MRSVARVQVWVKGRYVELPGEAARHVTANVWTVDVPRDEATSRRLRCPVDAVHLDEAVVGLDDDEAFQVVVSDENGQRVRLTVLMP